jgi:hypothetical protein
MEYIDNKIRAIDVELAEIDKNLKNGNGRGLKKIKHSLCVFPKCPKNALAKNTILFGEIGLGDQNLCLYNKCPKGSYESGTISNKTNKNKLCVYDKCPLGSKSIIDYAADGLVKTQVSNKGKNNKGKNKKDKNKKDKNKKDKNKKGKNNKDKNNKDKKR